MNTTFNEFLYRKNAASQLYDLLFATNYYFYHIYEEIIVLKVKPVILKQLSKLDTVHSL